MITYHSQIFFIKMVFCSSNNGQRRSRSQSVHFFFFVPEDKNLSRGRAGRLPALSTGALSSAVSMRAAHVDDEKHTFAAFQIRTKTRRSAANY